MRRFPLAALTLAIALSLVIGTAGVSLAGKPTVGAPCNRCHRIEDNVVRGTLGARSEKFSTINVEVGDLVWVIGYDSVTKVLGATDVASIPRGREIAVTFTGTVKTAKAATISVKQPYTLPDNQRADLAYMKEAVAKGSALIVDTRPESIYDEGHIPGAVSMPFYAFERMRDRVLPRERGALVVFYSSDETSMMSPVSATKAEDLGYTNLKVFQPGMPAWKQDGGLVVSEPQYVLEMMRKNVPHVLVDLRDKRDAKTSHIPGAVNIPAKELGKYKKKFPAETDAPVVLYTSHGVDEAAFRTLRGWGYINASVLAGGADGWTSGGGKLVEGKLESKITYEPAQLPGTIAPDDFEKILPGRPKNVLVLDVRDADETKGGMLPGAVNIPLSELDRRMGELPKDKDIVAHCSTGIRAMMAYDTLRKNGYKVRYLNAVIQIAPDGSFEISR